MTVVHHNNQINHKINSLINNRDIHTNNITINLDKTLQARVITSPVVVRVQVECQCLRWWCHKWFPISRIFNKWKRVNLMDYYCNWCLCVDLILSIKLTVIPCSCNNNSSHLWDKYKETITNNLDHPCTVVNLCHFPNNNNLSGDLHPCHNPRPCNNKFPKPNNKPKLMLKRVNKHRMHNSKQVNLNYNNSLLWVVLCLGR